MLRRIFLAVCNIKANSRCALLRKIYLFFPGLRISINLQMLFSNKNNIFLFPAVKCLFVIKLNQFTVYQDRLLKHIFLLPNFVPIVNA